jgi:hypothetical protein
MDQDNKGHMAFISLHPLARWIHNNHRHIIRVNHSMCKPDFFALTARMTIFPTCIEGEGERGGGGGRDRQNDFFSVPAPALLKKFYSI